MLTATADGLLHDGGRVFGPDERGRRAVPVGDVSLDVANQRTDGIERAAPDRLTRQNAEPGFDHVEPGRALGREVKLDRKSTRLNSSHGSISYAVFCLKKKKHK